MMPMPQPPAISQQGQPPAAPPQSSFSTAAQNMGQGGDQMREQSVQKLGEAVKGLGAQLKMVAQLGMALHPPMVPLIAQMAKIGDEMSKEVEGLMQQGQAGAAPPAGAQGAPSPTEGGGPGAA